MRSLCALRQRRVKANCFTANSREYLWKRHFSRQSSFIQKHNTLPPSSSVLSRTLPDGGRAQGSYLYIYSKRYPSTRVHSCYRDLRSVSRVTKIGFFSVEETCSMKAIPFIFANVLSNCLEHFPRAVGSSGNHIRSISMEKSSLDLPVMHALDLRIY